MIDNFVAIQVTGSVAGLLTLGAVIPQVIHTIRTKKTRDLSLLFLWLAIAELSFWGIYGGLTQDKFLIITASCACVLYGILVAYKLRGDTK
jgi:MtN3 and saliva related transmembrane protein